MPLMLIEELMEALTIRNTTVEPSDKLLQLKNIKESDRLQEAALRTMKKKRNQHHTLNLTQKLR